jgi:hypothetical protein
MPSVGKAVTRVELYDAVYREVRLSRSESSALVGARAKGNFRQRRKR